MNDKKQKDYVFIRCCYGYAISGMSSLVIGAILPSFMIESGISFSAAGGLLSMMAIGNLLASFVFPVMVGYVGKRVSITVLTGFVPVCLLALVFPPPLLVLYIAMLVYGMAKGFITILNNASVNDLFKDKAAGKLNILHCCFAVGAFLSPLLTAVFMLLGLGWKSVIYVQICLTATAALTYGTMNYELPGNSFQRIQKNSDSVKTKHPFLFSHQFYCIGLILFFYLGLENCINGWFVTYLQNTGVMSGAFATTLVSVTWLVIMAGRLVCAALTKKCIRSRIILMNAVGSLVCFLLLIATSNLVVITLALVGLGFFLAGIFPTAVADAGPLIQGSAVGMSVLTAISALGGIVTPQLVGTIADKTGIVAAITILTANVVIVVLLSIFNDRMSRQR